MADSVAGGASTKPGDATRLPTNVYPEVSRWRAEQHDYPPGKC